MDFAYCMYMAEQENCFPDEREASIKAVIEDLRASRSLGRTSREDIERILKKHNLSECLLSNSEIKRINRAINA